MQSTPPNNTSRLLMLLGAILLLSSCVSQFSQATPAAWLGATFAELQQSFGDPEAVLINASGNRVYVFRGRNQPSRNENTKLALGGDELLMEQAECAILFELETTTVVRWDWSGSNCSSASVLAPKPAG